MLVQGDELMQVALNCILTKFTISAQALPSHTEAQSSKVQNCDQESVPQAGPPVAAHSSEMQSCDREFVPNADAAVGSLQVSVQKSKMAGSILIRTVGQRSVLKQRAVPSFLAAGSFFQPGTPQGTSASNGKVNQFLVLPFFVIGCPDSSPESKHLININVLVYLLLVFVKFPAEGRPIELEQLVRFPILNPVCRSDRFFVKDCPFLFDLVLKLLQLVPVVRVVLFNFLLSPPHM
ncbi:uncharacterized protein LOC121835048 [Ixodes scapularis]|uniref:uncharacterized protein LOC121835048 n=1 Tax=Ixodes scapularis TaxID=6945 RepID=UPI001C395AE7|nr:uncharacterized protein LOC121835048 [Ixodes scapularis]